MQLVLFVILLFANMFSCSPKLEGVLINLDVNGMNATAIQEIENIRRETLLTKLYPTVCMDKSHLRALVDLCYKYEIDPDLALAIIYVESKYDPAAKNKQSSATGYGQLIKSTATAIANMIPEIESYNHSRDAYDPYINLHITIFYINRCIQSAGGNILNALRHYRGVEDRLYFNKVMKVRDELKSIKKMQRGTIK